MTFSVVLPCFNEAETIALTVEDVWKWMERSNIEGSIIAVDDGSKDATASVLEGLTTSYPTLRVVRHAQNQGYGAALRSGCDAATTEVIGFMDSDGQFHAEDFDGLLKAVSTQTPYVSGIRTKRADEAKRKLNAFLYNFLVRWILGVRIEDVNCGMKVFTQDVWKAARPECATGALFNAEMLYRMRRKHIAWTSVPVQHYPRSYGQQTGANLRVILRMFRELWALRRSC